jgi:dihydrofolate reductase
VEADREVYIIGGAQIYDLALPTVNRILATEIDASFPQAEIFFSTVGEEWQEMSREHHEADERNKYAFDFVTYIRH